MNTEDQGNRRMNSAEHAYLRLTLLPAGLSALCFLLFLAASGTYAATQKIDTTHFGAVADGITDDSEQLQKALRHCSEKDLICEIPAGKTHFVTKPLFMWGKSSLISAAGGGIKFDGGTSRYLLNLGISSKVIPGAPTINLRRAFSGEIRGLTFTVAGGNPPFGGRILYLWRSSGAVIDGNAFHIGTYNYSATSSGNDNNWVYGEKNSIRKNVTITNNLITASGTSQGNEGIGLGNFSGALISNNSIHGVGDDPIGVHLSENITITENTAASVDGRIFVSNSINVEISKNKHTRIASPLDGKFYKGIALIYVGFERLSIEKSNKTKYFAPENISVRGNELHYPEGAIDGNGSAIYIYSPRNIEVVENLVVNDSKPSDSPLYGIYILPTPVPGWDDPTGVDQVFDEKGRAVARVHDISIRNNRNEGAYPLSLVMSGNCVHYAGRVDVINNTAPQKAVRDGNRPGLRFYCLGDSVHLSKNELF